MDETYLRIRGKWRYLYLAVDKEGNKAHFFCELGSKRLLPSASQS
jgi:transposase-like protein